jgi:hypothetical protein
MKPKVLPIPCPYCGGNVISNGTVKCKKCKTEWRALTRKGNELMQNPTHTDSAVYMFGAVVHDSEMRAANIIAENSPVIDMRVLSITATHLERASKALALMQEALREQINGRR